MADMFRGTSTSNSIIHNVYYYKTIQDNQPLTPISTAVKINSMNPAFVSMMF